MEVIASLIHTPSFLRTHLGLWNELQRNKPHSLISFTRFHGALSNRINVRFAAAWLWGARLCVGWSWRGAGAQLHQPWAHRLHLHLCKLAWTDGGMMLERDREERTRREFLWFAVASDLCNQHAKLLMSKSTTRTRAIYTCAQTHIDTRACRHTLSEPPDTWALQWCGV